MDRPSRTQDFHIHTNDSLKWLILIPSTIPTHPYRFSVRLDAYETFKVESWASFSP